MNNQTVLTFPKSVEQSQSLLFGVVAFCVVKEMNLHEETRRGWCLEKMSPYFSRQAPDRDFSACARGGITEGDG